MHSDSASSTNVILNVIAETPANLQPFPLGQNLGLCLFTYVILTVRVYFFATKITETVFPSGVTGRFRLVFAVRIGFPTNRFAGAIAVQLKFAAVVKLVRETATRRIVCFGLCWCRVFIGCCIVVLVGATIVRASSVPVVSWANGDSVVACSDVKVSDLPLTDARSSTVSSWVTSLHAEIQKEKVE